jgi:hypothetical protein
MQTANMLRKEGAVGKTRVERRRIDPLGEGLSSDKSTALRSLRQTSGRFSVRGPAAWRVDGGTGKKITTRNLECKGLPNRLYRIGADHNPHTFAADWFCRSRSLRKGYLRCNQGGVSSGGDRGTRRMMRTSRKRTAGRDLGAPQCEKTAISCFTDYQRQRLSA